MKYKKALILGVLVKMVISCLNFLNKKKYKIIGIFRKLHKNKNTDHIDKLYKADVKSFFKNKKNY